jgi:hypothetical protein
MLKIKSRHNSGIVKDYYQSKMFSGKGNPRFDTSIHNFSNDLTGGQFTGTQYDFIHKFQLRKSDVCGVIHGKRHTVKNWRLIPQTLV